MSADAETAYRVADRVATEGSWDIFAERIRRYEIHLNGRAVEMIRGPIELEGYGLRILRHREGKTSVGFRASTDLSSDGVREAVREAEAVSRYSVFPAKKVDLPRPGTAGNGAVEVCDRRLWDHPLEYLQEHVEALLSAFEGKADILPSFGSLRATLSETSVANSAGLRLAYPQTTIDFEIAVKSFGGPEGAPPGEYWVNEASRRLEPALVPSQVEEWCRFARDVRRAGATPHGELPVVLPASVLTTILPSVIGSRLTGGARLREIAPDLGTAWGAEGLTVHDDGLFPWGLSSAPVDDEGVPQARRTVLDHGKVSSLLYDTLYAGAFETRSTGSGLRGISHAGFRDWRKFLSPASPVSTTLVIDPGAGGRDEELLEAAGEGIWVQQLGWAIPDPISGAFGGELRIGYRIRNGKLAEPIRGGSVGGVVMGPPGTPSLLSSVAAIGSTPTLCEWVSSPSLLVRPLTVAGVKT